MLKLRKAIKDDLSQIDILFSKYKFNLDFNHLQQLMVVERDNKIVAVGFLNTILEATFITDPNEEHKIRVDALAKLEHQACIAVDELGYENYHVFVVTDLVRRTLEKHFGFIPTIGKTLIKWVK